MSDFEEKYMDWIDLAFLVVPVLLFLAVILAYRLTPQRLDKPCDSAGSLSDPSKSQSSSPPPSPLNPQQEIKQK